MFWIFVHMLVQNGSVFDMCVFIVEGLDISRLLSIILCIISIDQDLKILKHLITTCWWIIGWRLTWCWNLSGLHWMHPLHLMCWTRGRCSMPNLAISLRSWTFSRGRSFLLDFFALVRLLPISKRLFMKTRLLPLQNKLKRRDYFSIMRW